MNEGVFRYREQYYRLPRPRIYTARVKPVYYLPDAAILDQWGRAKWFIFDDFDHVGFVINAQFDNHIVFEGTQSADNGSITSGDAGATIMLAAVPPDRWKTMFYTPASHNFTVA